MDRRGNTCSCASVSASLYVRLLYLVARSGGEAQRWASRFDCCGHMRPRLTRQAMGCVLSYLMAYRSSAGQTTHRCAEQQPKSDDQCAKFGTVRYRAQGSGGRRSLAELVDIAAGKAAGLPACRRSVCLATELKSLGCRPTDQGKSNAKSRRRTHPSLSALRRQSGRHLWLSPSVTGWDDMTP